MAKQSVSAEAAGRMKAPWEAGNFGAISRVIGTPAAADFAAALDLRVGEKVLDVACGTGAVAIPIARRGADVTGLDISPRMLEEAKDAAADAGVALTLDEGLVEEMPYPDAAFDLAVSMFGVMFSMMPKATVAELGRVLKPGGRLCVGNWTQSGFSGRFPGLVARFVPAPLPGSPSPFLWADDKAIRILLEPYFLNIVTERVSIEWRLDMGSIAAANFFMDNSGQYTLLSSMLEPQQYNELREATKRHWADANRASEPDRTLVSNEYLKLSAVRR